MGSTESGMNETKTAEQLLLKWFASLETEMPEEVVALYAPDAVLLPTIAPGVYKGHEALKDYFSQFLQHKPKGTLIEQHASYDGTTLVHAGLYDFQLTDAETGEARVAQARFSFIYTPAGTDNWQIVHHHSSVLPGA